MTAPKKLTTKAAIVQVLTGAKKPMRVKDIIEQAVPLTALSGKTPGQTIYSVLYGQAKKGTFIQTGKGMFKMGKVTPAKAPVKPAASKPAVKARVASKPKTTRTAKANA